ncbi:MULTISPECIES: hypothetical protein [Streptomyces]|uniref:hypothetical protein n=1 Tax=Streptomyces TaxID=1883 RepID=UPI00163C6D97|nr:MULTISPECIES: hypothetical protein [Streptomyces]MBC2877852.1 hypothetical protein [Streptomyces sp. TYQ1024]UBI37989.1 hypothetical protein K7I03_16930 [Streptomyces mobaraensis]UKW30576.1 hypothetical protein MCU78_16885 [Streptomyces sp. TYQ1024]
MKRAIKLAIGDVVRDRDSKTLGTVSGIAAQPTGNLVALQVTGGVRLVEPKDVEMVARRSEPMTTRRAVGAVTAFVLALLVAYLGGNTAHRLGADWLVVGLTSLGGYMAVSYLYGFVLRLVRPRRFRV